MADTSIAPAGPTDVPRRPKTPAERQRAFRQRQREKRQVALASADTVPQGPTGGQIAGAALEPPVTTTVTGTPATVSALPVPVTLVTKNVTSHVTDDVTASRPHVTERRSIVSYCLTAAALALAGVGIVMNGWFARTLGSTDLAGWTFLAIGTANDIVALTVPAAAAKLWLARQRVTAAVAWLVWSASFAFALISGLGFASINIADTNLARASRITPPVAIAQEALRDAVRSRDRECAGGVGRYCREREQTVVERQRALDAAVGSVERAADPQTEAASKIVAWLSGGNANPTAADFAMLRLLLLSLLPQVGGLLLMIGRVTKAFFDHTKAFIKALDVPQEKRADLMTGLYTYLKVDNTPTLSVSSFAKNYFEDEVADSFETFMKAKKFPTNAIQKDITDLQSQLRLRKMVFSNSIKLTAPPEAFKDMITVETIKGEGPAGAGQEWTRITIRDHIREES